MREQLSGRLGFLLVSAGCAVGLGNIWRFPYVMGQNGGGLFFVFYLLFLALIGVPVLMMEFAVGRAAQGSNVVAHAILTPEKNKRWWRLHGLMGMLGCCLLLMFYTVITGWILIYAYRMVTGQLAGKNASEIANFFDAMLRHWPLMGATAWGVVLFAGLVCAVGLRAGLERVSKVMMVSLLVLILVLAGKSVLQDCGSGEMKGLRFFLMPHHAQIDQVGLVRVLVEAANHAFFTLSIGIGCMVIFGSYLKRRHALMLEAVWVAIIDTFVAVGAGLMVLPACFAHGISPSEGPGLVFKTLPNVFCQMSGGRFWGACFFLFMGFAALTTVLSVFECLLANFCELMGFGRRKGCVVLSLLMGILSLPCVFGFNLWSSFQPLGKGSNVLVLEDFLVSNFLLPLGGLGFVVYCSHRVGWGWSCFREEVNKGQGWKLPAGFRFYCQWILPTLILVLFVVGLGNRLGWGLF